MTLKQALVPITDTDAGDARREQHVMRLNAKKDLLGQEPMWSAARSRPRRSTVPRSDARQTTILLVDNNELDVTAIKRAFKTLRIANSLVTASDGVEALEILRGGKGTAGLAAPHLVLLDLDLPRMDGLEFLTELRRDPALCQTVVFVLAGSEAPGDRQDAYRKNIAGYVLKPYPERNFTDSIAMLHHYWTTVQLPG